MNETQEPGTDLQAADLSEVDQFAPANMSLRLLQEAEAMETSFKIARSLSKTTMVPEQYRLAEKGEQAVYDLAVAIMYGAELGMSSIQSAQNIIVVKGKPSMYALAMAAVIRRAGYIMEEVEATSEKVVWKAFRDDTWSYSEWSIDRAAQAGYTSNSLYAKQPIAMLRAKCIAELARIKFQDCITGLAHTVEEMQLDGATVQALTKQRKRRSLREHAMRDKAIEGTVETADDAPATAETTPDPEPVVVEESTEGDDTTSDTPLSSDLSTTDQQEAIKGAARSLDWSYKVLLDEVTLFLQHDQRVRDLAELTSQEAEEVIAFLVSAVSQQPEEEGKPTEQ